MCNENIPEHVREAAKIVKFIMEDLNCSASEAMMIAERSEMFKRRSMPPIMGAMQEAERRW